MPGAPTSTQKQLLRAQGVAARYAGDGLLVMHSDLTAAQVAPALEAACLIGATELQVNGQLLSLKGTDALGHPYDFSFSAIAAGSGVQSCHVTVDAMGQLTVEVTGPGDWTSVNGTYLLDDPENLSDIEQEHTGRFRSQQTYKAALAALAESVTVQAADVAAALQPLCLTGFDSFDVNGQRFQYGLPQPPVGLAGCTVEVVGQDDFRMTVTTQNGGTYINGDFLPDDPRNLRPEEQVRNGRSRSRAVVNLARTLLAEDPTLQAPEVAAALQPLCLTAFNSVKVGEHAYAHSLPAAPVGLTACTVQATEGDDFHVTITTRDGGTFVDGGGPVAPQ